MISKTDFWFIQISGMIIGFLYGALVYSIVMPNLALYMVNYGMSIFFAWFLSAVFIFGFITYTGMHIGNRWGTYWGNRLVR